MAKGRFADRWANEPVRKTRFKELGYWRIDDRTWCFLDIEGGKNANGLYSQIGPHYPSEKALLADLDRYAFQYGCNPEYRPAIADEPCVAAELERLRKMEAALKENLDAIPELVRMCPGGGHEDLVLTAAANLVRWRNVLRSIVETNPVGSENERAAKAALGIKN
jgi:hypothetical protein